METMQGIAAMVINGLNARGYVMGKISGKDYQKMLEEAGDAVEQEARDNLLSEELDARLNALEAGGFEISEAERLAAMADKPRERIDGKIVGIAEGPSRPLTKQMIAFAQGVIEGKSQRQAYRDAYPNAKGNDGTISACAHKLSKDPRIKRMIESGWEETTEALAEDLAAQRRYVARALVALSKGAKQEGSRLKALELLGRSAGMFKDNATQAVDKPITAEELRRELAGHLRLVASAARKPAPSKSEPSVNGDAAFKQAGEG